MTRMKRLPKPTASELAILQVLWRRGPSTVRQVLYELDPGTGYTTALKLMQIMAEKGLATRDEAARSHVYHAAVPEAQTLGGIVGDLLDAAFGGSSQKLLLAALSAKRASPHELEEMRQLIEQAQQKNSRPSPNREQP
jgi:predicted transcriptional regulator